MQKIQTSKHPYSGLARVRSAGELVVGLDQNNLPFSTAHPEPAGLDYEIAGLLAEQLGVSLRVYWAYSAHDSYPSKLATKRLCDVILGVMPDDRFGAAGPLFPAVLSSRSISWSSGRAKVRPRHEEPLAVEEGVAVRGLKGATGAVVSQHRGDPRSRRDGASEGGLRDLDARPLAGPASDGRASSRSCPPPSRADRFPDLRGGAQDGRRPEGRDRPGLG